MITRKYNRTYSERELNNFLASVSSIEGGQTKKVDRAWRKLGYINASAYKGYGCLSNRHAEYNYRVYSTKEKAILILAQHTDNIAAIGGVLYVRTLDGIQLSFHLGSMRWCPKELSDLHQKYMDKNAVWDGVPESYTYKDINAYNEARAEYQRKRDEDEERRQRNIAAFYAGVRRYFAHHARRKACKLPIKKKDWEDYCKQVEENAQKHWEPGKLGYGAYLILQEYVGNPACCGRLNFDEMKRISRHIEANMYDGWNDFNFNHE